MSYPVAVNLPFNSAAVNDCFARAAQGTELSAGNPWYAVIQGNALVVEDAGSGLSLLRALPVGLNPGNVKPVCLGLWHGEPLYAVRIPKEVDIRVPYRAESFNATEELLNEKLLTIGGFAQQILYWNSISRVCARCGGEMGAISGTWGKQCLSCSHERYPAVHPCAIVLVRDGDRFLLIRKPEWGEGRFSLVAGFLDFGESLEECAIREVKEETGVDVCNVRYVGSQSWPFPSQLMAGFVADYVGGDIVVDTTEIAEARWFSRDNLPLSFPTRRSIARWIIDNYALAE